MPLGIWNLESFPQKMQVGGSLLREAIRDGIFPAPEEHFSSMEITQRIPCFRAPSDHISIRILQTMVSGVPPYTGPWSQNVRSLCLCGCLGLLGSPNISGLWSEIPL